MKSAEFETIYRQYLQVILNFVYYQCGDRHTAEDITADVFISTFEYCVTQQKYVEHIKSWLFTLARNKLINRYKHQSRYTTIDVDSHIAETDDLDSMMAYDEQLQIISGLEPLIYRQVVLLKYKFEFSFTEICKITGKSNDNIRKIHERALKKLKTLNVRFSKKVTNTKTERAAQEENRREYLPQRGQSLIAC